MKIINFSLSKLNLIKFIDKIIKNKIQIYYKINQKFKFIYSTNKQLT